MHTTDPMTALLAAIAEQEQAPQGPTEADRIKNQATTLALRRAAVLWQREGNPVRLRRLEGYVRQRANAATDNVVTAFYAGVIAGLVRARGILEGYDTLPLTVVLDRDHAARFTSYGVDIFVYVIARNGAIRPNRRAGRVLIQRHAIPILADALLYEQEHMS